MWKEAKANEKRVKEAMANHKKRAERRRAYYDSRLGDPRQLLRVIGSSSKLYPNAEQFSYHEDLNNFMPLPSDPQVRIDRFDGRSLLDFVPETSVKGEWPKDERDMAEALNFERYQDLIETERLNVTEEERLRQVEEEWTNLLDRQKALVAMADDKNRQSTHHTFAYDYGTEDQSQPEEPQLLNETDILQHVNDLTDKDKQTLNDMARKYGITNYIRLLRHARKDRDEQLRELQQKQGGRDGRSKESNWHDYSSKGGSRSRKSRRGRSRRFDDTSYDNDYFSDSSDSTDGPSDEETSGSGVVIEFGSSESQGGWQPVNPDEASKKPTHYESKKDSTRKDVSKSRHRPDAKPSVPKLADSKPVEKKLTPMEKLKLRMREGLEKQVKTDEAIKYRKEREREFEELQQNARRVPERTSSFARPPLPVRPRSGYSNGRRYRSPSSSRSPSPTRGRKASHRQSDRSSNSSRSKSPSSKRSERRRRHRSRSPSRSSRKQRYRSPSTSRSPSPHGPTQETASPPRTT